MLGKAGEKFSRPWKTELKNFQGLENRSGPPARRFQGLENQINHNDRIAVFSRTTLHVFQQEEQADHADNRDSDQHRYHAEIFNKIADGFPLQSPRSEDTRDRSTTAEKP